MRKLTQIEALHREINSYFEDLTTKARASNEFARAEAIRAKQIINDQAFFLLCWGQLKSEVNDVCRRAIKKRVTGENWAKRRAWDLYNPDDPRLSGLKFEDRVALVLDKQGGRGSPWALVMFYYEIRNQIAHGTLKPDRIDVTDAVREFFIIQSHLQA